MGLTKIQFDAQILNYMCEAAVDVAEEEIINWIKKYPIATDSSGIINVSISLVNEYINFRKAKKDRMITPFKQLFELHKETCEAARELMVKKSHDYTNGSTDPFANFRGSEFLNVPAEIGILIRMMDKFKRIETFVSKNDLKVEDENVFDSITDIINYSILLKGIILSRRKEKGLKDAN